MTRYIKREDAFKTLLEQCKITGYGGLTPADVKFAFSNIPNADVRKNVHGQWILVDDGTDYWAFWECSNCHNECYAEGKMRMKYCPECGAQMDEGDEP